ncbi:phosphonate C-P lyase system protein PhnH [Mycolicibacterium elephantis]|uniref:phosphonate C-P lyase system protein PhnH n=1 Tax=Mycolicibacterium elephantis TaxID=81858 RepID=UPI0007EB6F40|nr:phosphonate C-P lyase system protein PhnH [Mycolicibacterium elephantis]OBA71906.1 phosphonate C-P lyase system protein PhnH [Mycolicibacterium elephantis]
MRWDRVHDGRTAFLACMWAMCTPGTPIELGCLPRIGARPELDGAAGVLLALLDRGLTLGVSGGEATHQVAAAVMAETGARPGDVADADWVLVHGAAADAIACARRGGRLSPERGATLVLAAAAEPHPVSIAGPGVHGQAEVWVPLDEVAVRAFAAANSAPPCGVDLLIVTGNCVIGLPRSVALGVV